MWRRGATIVAIVAVLFLAGCGGSAGQSFKNQAPPPSSSNPTPTIATISPTSTAAGGFAFTLTVNGTNFLPGQATNGTNVTGSVVNFGGMAAITTFVSATQLTAVIPAAAIVSAGIAVVTVANPAPGGGTSNAVNFTITSTSGPNPVPAIDINGLSPNCAPAGGPAFGLYVSGSNFVPNSVVQWNGSDRPTTVFDPGDALAQIPASDIVATGTPAVTVFNPAPGGGSSNPSTFTVTPGGVNPQSIAVDPTGKFAYVADAGCTDGSVSMYTIDATTGALASIGPPIDSLDEGARSVTVDPTGKFAYVANWGEGDTAGSVSMYTINATTGALTSTGGISGGCPGLCAPWSAVVHPSGKFAYVANEGGPAPTGVSMFTINATTGALTFIGTVASGGRAVAVAVDPKGKFAYVADMSNGFPGENNDVSMYTINPGSGGLTSIGTIAAGTDPTSVAVDPTGKFVYVANSGSKDISMYTINATTGTLTSLGTIDAGNNPSSVAVDPTGKFAYVTNSGSNDISMYTIDGTTGALTSIGTIAAGSSPSSIAIHPLGKFAYVTNAGSNDVSMYSISTTTGALTLIGTIGT